MNREFDLPVPAPGDPRPTHKLRCPFPRCPYVATSRSASTARSRLQKHRSKKGHQVA